MDKENKCKNCGHDRKYHAIKEKHELQTSHCTFIECDCKEFVNK